MRFTKLTSTISALRQRRLESWREQDSQAILPNFRKLLKLVFQFILPTQIFARRGTMLLSPFFKSSFLFPSQTRKIVQMHSLLGLRNSDKISEFLHNPIWKFTQIHLHRVAREVYAQLAWFFIYNQNGELPKEPGNASYLFFENWSYVVHHISRTVLKTHISAFASIYGCIFDQICNEKWSEYPCV